MIFPIIAYGHPKLRHKCETIAANNVRLQNLIASMWETMYASVGSGLAAPQIGKSLRLFTVDTEQVYDNSSHKERKLFLGDKGIKQVFINPVILETAGESWVQTEGCLSIPRIQLDIERKMSVVIRYLNEDFVEKESLFIGQTARTVLHEYDHIEGILFTDYVDKKDIQDGLDRIIGGGVKTDYKMKFNKITASR